MGIGGYTLRVMVIPEEIWLCIARSEDIWREKGGKGRNAGRYLHKIEREREREREREIDR